eukprot:XP_017946997.1 PREDICTED: uncharacterized protein LOC108645771 [Xenopus tropicalis]
MEARSKILQLDCCEARVSGNRPYDNLAEQESEQVLFQIQEQGSDGLGLFQDSVVVQVGLCVSPHSINWKNPEEDKGRQGRGDCSTALVAQTKLVSPVVQDDNFATFQNPSSSKCIETRSVDPPQSREIKIDGLATERLNLLSKGLSDNLVNTLLAARKPSTSQKYYKIWEIYIKWCLESGRSPVLSSPEFVVEFLQSGLDLGLSASTHKGQVSALSILFGENWVIKPLIIRFFQALKRIKPRQKNRVPPWDHLSSYL